MAKKQLHADHLRQALVLLFALAQIPISIATTYGGLDFVESTQSFFTNPPIVPASYAFSIWGLIYAWTIVYAIYQFLPSQLKNKRFRRIGWLSALSFAGTSLWLVFALYNKAWLTMATMLVILGALLMIMRDFMEHPSLDSNEKLLVFAPLSVFAGWISVATFANLASVLAYSGWYFYGAFELSWTLGFILAAGLLSSLLTRATHRNWGYSLTVLWGLAGIIVANMQAGNSQIVALTSLISLILFLSTATAKPAKANWLHRILNWF